jgi:hypothetical protein
LSAAVCKFVGENIWERLTDTAITGINETGWSGDRITMP